MIGRINRLESLALKDDWIKNNSYLRVRKNHWKHLKKQ